MKDLHKFAELYFADLSSNSSPQTLIFVVKVHLSSNPCGIIESQNFRNSCKISVVHAQGLAGDGIELDYTIVIGEHVRCFTKRSGFKRFSFQRMSTIPKGMNKFSDIFLDLNKISKFRRLFGLEF
jgi:hypothetical protein